MLVFVIITSRIDIVAQAEFRFNAIPVAIFTIWLAAGLLPYGLTDALSYRQGRYSCGQEYPYTAIAR